MAEYTFFSRGLAESQARHLLRPGRQFGVGRDDAQLLLAGKGLLAHLVPALVELAFELGDPFGRGLLRRMPGGGGIIDKERFVGGDRLLHLDPLDRFVGKVEIQVVVGFAQVGLDGRRPVKEGRPPVVRQTADEAVKLLEAEPGRPAVERTRLAGFPVGHVVILTKPRGVVAVERQHGAYGGHLLAQQGVVAGESRRHLGDGACMRRMMIPSGDQRGPRRAADRGGVEAVIAKTVGGQFVERRGGDGATKRGRFAKADVVEQYQHDIRSTRRGGDFARE